MTFSRGVQKSILVINNKSVSWKQLMIKKDKAMLNLNVRVLFYFSWVDTRVSKGRPGRPVVSVSRYKKVFLSCCPFGPGLFCSGTKYQNPVLACFLSRFWACPVVPLFRDNEWTSVPLSLCPRGQENPIQLETRPSRHKDVIELAANGS